MGSTGKKQKWQAAQNRSEWRQSVAQCSLGYGLNQGQGQGRVISRGFGSAAISYARLAVYTSCSVIIIITLALPFRDDKQSPLRCQG